MAKLKWKKDQADWYLAELGLVEAVLERDIENKWIIYSGDLDFELLFDQYSSAEKAKEVVENVLKSQLTKIVKKLNAKTTKSSTKLTKKTKRTKIGSSKKNE